MTRRNQTIEERPEPSLVYLRRTHVGASIELVIVEDGRSTIWPVSDDRALRMAADATGFLASRPAKS